MVEGVSSDPFSMKTLPPFQTDGDPDFIEKVRKQSRQRYAMERGKLEKLMNAWNKKSFSAKEKNSRKKPDSNDLGSLRNKSKISTISLSNKISV